MKVLIVDDESLARARLRRLLAAHSEFECVGEAGNAQQALRAIAELQPDLLLLDIAMPGQNGLSLAMELLKLPTPPAVIFVTAHPQHALDAYAACPADYLLKPVAAERLAQALQRLGTQTRAHVERKLIEPKLNYVLAGIKRQLDLKDVQYFKAEDKYVKAVLKSGDAIIEHSLAQLLEQYPEQLVRIHRSTLVNKTCLARMYTASGKHFVLLTDGETKLEVSRREMANLRKAFVN